MIIHITWTAVAASERNTTFTNMTKDKTPTVTIDLEAVQAFNSIDIMFNNAPSVWALEVSGNGADWHVVDMHFDRSRLTKVSGDGIPWNTPNQSNNNNITPANSTSRIANTDDACTYTAVFDTVSARYVRFRTICRSPMNGSGNNNDTEEISIYEIEVYNNTEAENETAARKGLAGWVSKADALNTESAFISKGLSTVIAAKDTAEAIDDASSAVDIISALVALRNACLNVQYENMAYYKNPLNTYAVSSDKGGTLQQAFNGTASARWEPDSDMVSGEYKDADPWIQVDFGKIKMISKVAV